MKRTPLKAQSRKRRQLAPKRAAFVAQFLAKNPRCQVAWDRNCQLAAVHVHEPLTRARGGSITDPANAVATCWWCHSQLHAHPAEAARRGFLRSAHDHDWMPVILDDPPRYDAEATIAAAARRWGLAREAPS
jgi:hypothetical protein